MPGEMYGPYQCSKSDDRHQDSLDIENPFELGRMDEDERQLQQPTTHISLAVRDLRDTHQNKKKLSISALVAPSEVGMELCRFTNCGQIAWITGRSDQEVILSGYVERTTELDKYSTRPRVDRQPEGSNDHTTEDHELAAPVAEDASTCDRKWSMDGRSDITVYRDDDSDQEASDEYRKT